MLRAKCQSSSESKSYGKHISCTLTPTSTHLTPTFTAKQDNSFTFFISCCLCWGTLFIHPPFPVAGRPQPRVTWLHGNTVYKDSSVGQSLSERRVGNVLSLPRLERKNLHMQLTCRAENNNLTTPIISSVVLDMNCESYPSSPSSNLGPN